MSTIFSAATFHSLVRAKERIGVKGKHAEKRIRLAVDRGKSAEYFSAKEKRYLEHESSNGLTALAYNAFCYLVNDDGLCVTMYPLPNWFGKKMYYTEKEKIRDVKKYFRNYNSCLEVAV